MSTIRRAWLAVALLLLLLTATVPAGSSSFVIPDAPDVRIKTRHSVGAPGAVVSTQIVTLKGARQRRDVVERPNLPDRARKTYQWIQITQCDERRTLRLNADAKTYAYEPIVDLDAQAARVRAEIARHPHPQPAPSAAELAARPVVTITNDSVDTGERRTLGSYTARHVISTRRVDPGPGAHTLPALDQMDAWYLDLPDQNCQDANVQFYTLGAVLTMRGAERPERIEYKDRGTARRGFPIEATHRITGDGRSAPLVQHIELLEISEAPVDPAVFTVPTGYRPALPDVYGGHDMSKPDTFLNRIELYEQTIALWANRVFTFHTTGY